VILRQCDGCARGLRLRRYTQSWMHVGSSQWDISSCTLDRYLPKPMFLGPYNLLHHAQRNAEMRKSKAEEQP